MRCCVDGPRPSKVCVQLNYRCESVLRESFLQGVPRSENTLEDESIEAKGSCIEATRLRETGIFVQFNIRWGESKFSAAVDPVRFVAWKRLTHDRRANKASVVSEWRTKVCPHVVKSLYAFPWRKPTGCALSQHSPLVSRTARRKREPTGAVRKVETDEWHHWKITAA